MPDTSYFGNARDLDYTLQIHPDGTLKADIRGRLEAGSIGPLWKDLAKKLQKSSVSGLIFDLKQVHYMDMSGQALLLHFSRLMRERKASVEIANLRPDFQHVQEQIECFDCSPRNLQPQYSGIEELGRAFLNLGRDIKQFFSFLGEFLLAIFYTLTHPRSVRWRDVLLHVEHVGSKAVFIIVLMGFLIGLIIAFQSAIALEIFGAQIFVAHLLGLSIVRELAPLVTAIILAARSGSSYAAEIGTMKINEEINALETMGLSPVRFLMIPKMFSAVLVTPFLCLFFMFFSFVGGAVVMLSLDFTLTLYIEQLNNAIGLNDLLGGLFKVFVFSLLVAWVGCIRGFQTGDGASAVGLSTTSAVVSAIVLIILADGIFALVYYTLGI